MQSKTLTSIAMLIEIPENELNTLPEEAKKRTILVEKNSDSQLYCLPIKF